jgi:hypothetical protein
MFKRAACWAGVAVIGLLVAATERPSVGQEPAKKEDAKGRFVVTAQLFVVENQPDPTRRDQNYLESHAVVLQSQRVIEEAINKRDLKALDTLKNVDASVFISSHLTVKIPAGRNKTLELSYECSNAEDGVKILNAVIEIYQSLVKAVFGSSVEDLLAKYKEEEVRLNEQLSAARKQHDELIRAAPEVLLAGNDERELGNTYALQYHETHIRATSLQADREWVKKAGSESLGVQLAARRWSKEAGYDAGNQKIQDVVQAYARYLDDEITRMEIRASTFQAEATKRKDLVRRERWIIDSEERVNKRLEQVDVAMRALSSERRSQGFSVYILVKPQAKEIGKN